MKRSHWHGGVGTEEERNAKAERQRMSRLRRARARDIKRGHAPGNGSCSQDVKPLIICVWQLKGGVGKSPIALELAHALTRKGKNVGLLDMDAQATLSQMLADAAAMKKRIDYRYVRGNADGLKPPKVCPTLLCPTSPHQQSSCPNFHKCSHSLLASIQTGHPQYYCSVLHA